MIRSTSKFLLLLLLFSRLSQTLLASTPFPVGSIHNGDSLGRYLMLFKDESAELTAEQVATRLPEFTLSQADSPNWQVSSARTWAYFQINNPLDVEQTLYLENNYAQTDFISLYSLSQARISLLDRLGDHLPFANRQFFYRNAVFTMKLKPGLNEYLVSVQTTGTNLMPFKIWTPKAFHLKAPAENLFIGVAFGLVIFMVIYNFFIFVSLRSLSTLYYVAYGLCFIVMQISFQGVSGYVFENFPLQFC